MTIKVGMISLGCSKNQVDAERLLAMLAGDGFTICNDMTECDAVIVNTCGFIEDAKKESIDTILECCAAKGEGSLKCVAVTGCLAERYREELAREIPEADVVLGIGSNRKIGEAIRKAVMGEHFTEYGEKESLSMEGERMLANEPWFAYVKVAEGCDNRCSYCAIPLIRGRFRSRPMENVIEECKELAARGVTELNLVAQDTTRYGEDIYGESRLPELIDAVCEIEGVHWVRILYCYPDRVTDKLIDTIARQPKAVHYFDIPVQHASAHVLRDMNRRGDRRSITALCQKIREKIPDVVLRTTLIAGFPTESEEDFAELCKLVEEVRFDRLGCFAYSQEEDTPAAELEQIPLKGGPHGSEGAAFGSDHIGSIRSSAVAQWPEAVGIPDGDKLGGGHHHERIGSLQLGHGPINRLLDGGSGYPLPGNHIGDGFRVRSGVENGS